MKKTVLITGGARGIGAAIAAEFHRHGHEVFAPTRAELDLASAEALEDFIRRTADRPVDILINNAGINVLSLIESLDASVWRTMLQVNLTSPVRLTQAFLPGMKARGWGRVLCVSSILGLVAREKRAAYSMTKAALNAFVRSMAVEYGPDGILANSLCPGYVDSALTRQNNSPEEIAVISATIPLRRLAQPEEIARVAYFLGSDENTYISGQAIVADGGFLSR
ncbi:MAG: SDR family oxidoreductase [Methylacidiphilales bacterium]|nr:SDR family oxidoreductase [Candidatus Methylacidiphilales bacterium]